MQPSDTQNDTQPTTFFFSLVLVEVVFTLRGEVNVLKRQIFEKSTTPNFPADRVHRLNNVAALQLRQSLPAEDQEHFRALDAFILAIVPLGQMTDEQFWADITPPSDQGGQEAPVAVPETAQNEAANSPGTSNNVVQGTFPGASGADSEGTSDPQN